MRFWREHGDLAVVQEENFLGVFQYRRRVGGDEVLILSETQHDRGTHPRGNEFFRLAFVLKREPVRSANIFESREYGFFKFLVFLQVLLDEVRDDLGIGIGNERMALRDEVLPKFPPILDYAVM